MKERIKGTSILGLRTLKTVIAVMLSAVIMKYCFDQTPFFACIGAVVAMERNMSTTLQAVVVRNVGTIVGGIVGIIFSLLTQNVLILALGLIPMIYVDNILDKKDSIVAGSIVYFAVVYLNTSTMAIDYGVQRILGTLLGSLIGMAVNFLLFKPKKEQAKPVAAVAVVTKEEIPSSDASE